MAGLLILAALAMGANAPQVQGSGIGVKPPKLVVLIAIDQFRGDYIQRFNPYFLPAKTGGKLGGFKYLMETGADFQSATHNHLPTATGPGHATLMSGSEPAYDGIAGNDWYDRTTGKAMYCVDDASVETVGGTSGPMSPRNLLVSTVGDELKMATNGRSKVVGVALKDRAAILMAGHAADDVVWFDNNTGHFVSSTWYCPSKKLAPWTESFNKDKWLDKVAGKSWEPLLPNEAYGITRLSPGQTMSPTGKQFSHKMPTEVGKSLYGATWTTNWGNEVTLAAATAAVKADKLGMDEYPDVLVINLSSNDYIGHAYGPNSPEVMDITVRTDRMLSDFINMLNSSVPGGMDNVAMVVTGDHGVVPVVEESRDTYKLPYVRGVEKAAVAAAQKALVEKYGTGDWVVKNQLFEQNLYLNLTLIKEKGLKQSEVEQTAVDGAITAPGVFGAYSRTQIMNNGLPNFPFKDRILNGFNVQRGGDLMILEGPGDYMGGGTSGTGHGSVWDYDAHVPILFRAKGVKPGIYLNPVHTSDIASTISKLLGIEVPSGNVGRPLVDTISR